MPACVPQPLNGSVLRERIRVLVGNAEDTGHTDASPPNASDEMSRASKADNDGEESRADVAADRARLGSTGEIPGLPPTT